MSKRDTMIRALCKSLGVDYRVTTIDLERVIYRVHKAMTAMISYSA